MTNPRSITVVGAGAIGASWTVLALQHGFRVTCLDVDPTVEPRVREAVARIMGGPVDFAFDSDISSAVAGAHAVVECGPEDLGVKQDLLAALDRHVPPHVLLLSSSSGLRPSDLQATCALHPERVVVAHPFNPPHLMPLVEVVGGRRTAAAAIDQTMSLMVELGRHPIHVRAELPGHVANRLQAALWREAYSLIERGVVSVADLDAAIAYGPGLRWALLGPIATQHLSSGAGGLTANLQHLGPAIESWWDDLGDPRISAELVAMMAAGVDEEFAGEPVAEVARRRDAALADLLALKQRHGITHDRGGEIHG